MTKEELQAKIDKVKNKCDIWTNSGDRGACLSYESNGEFWEWCSQLENLEE